MRVPLRELGRFVLGFAVLFPLCVLAYPLALPVYHDLVLALTNGLLSLGGVALSIELLAGQGWSVAMSTPRGAIDTPALDPHGLDVVYLNLALLPALLLATPVRALVRLRLLALGAGLLMGCHVLGMLALAYSLHCLTRGQSGEALCLMVSTTAGVQGQLMAFAQWSILTGGFWIRVLAPPPAPQPLEPATRPLRNASRRRRAERRATGQGRAARRAGARLS